MDTVTKLFGTMEGDNTLAPLLYRLDSSSELGYEVVNSVGHICVSNGPTWSLDGKSFFFACTGMNVIRRFDYDQETGAMSNPRELLRMTPELSEKGRFDGATMDAEGYLWWALWGGGKVIRFHPDTPDKIERELVLPGLWAPTSVAFGGPDYRTLLVTSFGLELPSGQPAGGHNGGIALVRYENEPNIRGVPPSKWNGK